MKKSSIGIVVYIICALFIINATFAAALAANNRDDLPIRGQDVLRKYALGLPIKGFRAVSAETLVQLPGENTWVEVRGIGAEDILEKLFKANIKYGLKNASDTVTGWVYLYDASGNQVFAGNAEYMIDQMEKGDGPNYNIWTQNVPLPIKEGVSSAEVIILNDDGQSSGRQIRVDVNERGQVMFQPWLAGADNGILSLRLSEGSTVSYDLWAPVAQLPVNATERAQWSIRGHTMVPAVVGTNVVVKIIAIYDRPTVTVDILPGQTMTVDVIGLIQDQNIRSERPTHVYYEQVSGPLVGDADLGNQSTVVKTGMSGRFRLHFEWNEFGTPNHLYAGPVDDGIGKGSVEAQTQ